MGVNRSLQQYNTPVMSYCKHSNTKYTGSGQAYPHFLFLSLNEKKSIIIKTVNRVCVKDVKIYFIGLKKDLFGCFRKEEIRDKNNETGLKEGGGIEISNYSAFHIRDARSLRFESLTFRPLLKT